MSSGDGSRVVDEILAAIEPGSAEAAAAARERLTGREDAGALAALAVRLAGARHVALPPVVRKRVVVLASGDAAAQASALAAGTATANVLARAAGAELTVIDCGLAGAVDPGVVDLRPDEHVDALDTGAALVLSLAGDGLDALALAVLGADDAGELAADLLDRGAEPRAALAARSPALAALAGVCCACAALRIPVVLDAGGAPIAALAAARLAPAVADYCVAGHAGLTDGDRRALVALGLTAALDAGLTGAGAGAAAALPLLDAAARLVREPAVTRRLRVVDDEPSG